MRVRDESEEGAIEKRTESSLNETDEEQLPSGEHLLPFGQQ